MKIKIQFIFKWYDLWIGIFYDRTKKWIYVLPLPMIGFIVKLPLKYKRDKRWDNCNHEWETMDVSKYNPRPQVAPVIIQRCKNCGFYIGGVDSYKTIKRLSNTFSNEYLIYGKEEIIVPSDIVDKFRKDLNIKD